MVLSFVIVASVAPESSMDTLLARDECEVGLADYQAGRHASSIKVIIKNEVARAHVIG